MANPIRSLPFYHIPHQACHYDDVVTPSSRIVPVLWKGINPIVRMWKAAVYNPSIFHEKRINEAATPEQKRSAIFRTLCGLKSMNYSKNLSELVSKGIQSFSKEEFSSFCQDVCLHYIKNPLTYALDNFVKFAGTSQFEQLIPHSIKEELKHIAKMTSPSEGYCNKKEWHRVSAMFKTFIPNLVNTLLLQFNYWSDGRLPETDWAMNCFFEIHYKLFMIPIALFIVANTVLSSPVLALGVTVAIMAGLITSLYIYVKCFQKCPIALPNCRNLTLEAAMGRLSPVIGREEEIERVITYLGNLEKDQSLNPLLTGESGVGKTEIMNGIAQRIVKGDVPPSLRNKTLFCINTAALVEGGFDGYAKKLDAIMLRLRGFQGEVIIFFDEIHVAMQKDKKTLANFLKTFAVPGGIHCVAATTTEGYKEIQKDPAFAGRFQRIHVECADGMLTRQILHQKVKLSEPAVMFDMNILDKIYEETDSRIAQRDHPSKDIDVLTHAINKVEVILEGNNHIPIVLRNKRNEMESLKAGLEFGSIFDLQNGKGDGRVEELFKVQQELQTLEKEWDQKSAILKKTHQLVELYKSKKKEFITHVHAIEASCKDEEMMKKCFLELYFLLPELEKSIAELEKELGPDYKIRVDEELIKTVIEELFTLSK